MAIKIYTFSEAAKVYGFSDGSVFRNWVRRGKLKESEAWKSGDTWLIKKSAIDRVLKKNEYNSG